MAHDIVSGHEPIGIAPLVVAAWELQSPVGEYQAEAVPTSPPRLAYLAALEDDMLDPCVRELVAQGETGLSCADHHNVNSFGHDLITIPWFELATGERLTVGAMNAIRLLDVTSIIAVASEVPSIVDRNTRRPTDS